MKLRPNNDCKSRPVKEVEGREPKESKRKETYSRYRSQRPHRKAENKNMNRGKTKVQNFEFFSQKQDQRSRAVNQKE